jgi:hypothetical protein
LRSSIREREGGRGRERKSSEDRGEREGVIWKMRERERCLRRKGEKERKRNRMEYY